LTTGRTFESSCPDAESPKGCEAGGEQYSVDESIEFTLHVELPIQTENSSTSDA